MTEHNRVRERCADFALKRVVLFVIIGKRVHDFVEVAALLAYFYHRMEKVRKNFFVLCERVRKHHSAFYVVVYDAQKGFEV